ncbi:hypothetical protein GOP47_0007694 [Adiantum capillus-veneris]|uniref:Uncharacterized protein n=1 Tax=Adiantum capillus-veneris TaxID=13818 RepID=A0A9D4V1S4_ADICA|nr:hypothetical protein GOP47_0007694 [Adiantum capillus-veneris]
MTRIRKRPPSATSSVKPELLATSNGCPPQLGAQSNPSFQDPRQALLCAASWPVKEDRLLLVSPAATNSGHGGSLASEKEVKKQLAATPAARHYAKPYIIAQRGGDGEGLGMTRKTMTVGEAKLRDTEVHQQEYRARKHMLDGEGDETCIASKREAENRSCHAGGGERSEGACKERAILAGSEQFTGKLRHTDPSDADDGASEQPRKMLPLQLILNSVPRHATAAPRPMIPNDQLLRTTASDTMMPSSSSTSVSCGTKRLNLKQQWEVDDSARVGGSEQKPSLLQTRKPQPLSEEAPESESSDVKIQGGSKSMREERGGLSSSDQSPDWPVSSWQGHRRARSSGRLVNEAAPGLLGRVNLDAHHAPINSKIITSERKVKVFPIEKSKAGTQLKKTPLPASEKVISVPLKNLSPSNCASKKRKRDAAAANGDVTHYSSAAPDSSHDHAILADSMRCRRKDATDAAELKEPLEKEMQAVHPTAARHSRSRSASGSRLPAGLCGLLVSVGGTPAVSRSVEEASIVSSS